MAEEIDKFDELMKRKDEEIASLKKQLLQTSKDDSPILDNLDDGIEFTGSDDEDEKNQMSLF